MQFLYQKMVQLLYCYSAVPIPQNGPVTVLSQCSSYTKNGPVTVLPQCSSYTSKWSCYCIVTVQFLYHKTVQVLHFHSTVPIPKTVQWLHCHSAVPILQKVLVTVLSQCSSYTTKPSRYCIVRVHFLYHKTVQLLYCHSAVPIIEDRPVTVLSLCSSYTKKWSSYCIFTVQIL